MIPVLKQMILQGELGMEMKSYSDVTQDSASDVEPNVSAQPQPNQ